MMETMLRTQCREGAASLLFFHYGILDDARTSCAKVSWKEECDRVVTKVATLFSAT